MDSQTFVNDVKSNDGATVSTHGESLPLSGFYVSDDNGAIVDADTFSASDVDAFANSRALTLSSPGVYLGAWINDGKVYLDVTRHFYSREVALSHGALNNQLAIWDIANSEELPVSVAA